MSFLRPPSLAPFPLRFLRLSSLSLLPFLMLASLFLPPLSVSLQPHMPVCLPATTHAVCIHFSRRERKESARGGVGGACAGERKGWGEKPVGGNVHG